MVKQGDNKKSYMQEFRAKRLAHGLCMRCGKNPHRAGKRTCGCDNEYFQTRKRVRVKDGLCTGCGNPNEDVSIQLCQSCQLAYSTREKRRQVQNVTKGVCAQCGKGKPEEGQKWCDGCCEKARVYGRKVKAEVIAAYGGICKCCKERRIGFLTIDHINGGGTAHRKELRSPKIYNWLRGKKYPQGFQVLCFNCNCGRSVNGGTCPHEEEIT